MNIENQRIIAIWCKVLNEVETDATFLHEVDEAAYRAARQAEYECRARAIRDEVLRRMQEKVWSYLESEG